MAGRRYKRIPGKSLPEGDAVRVFAAKAMQVEEDIVTFSLVPDFIRWGLRPSLTIELTGLPDILIRRIVKREGLEGPHGRFSHSISTLFESPLMHLSATLFIELLKIRVDPVTRKFGAIEFHAAYRNYLSASSPHPPALNPNAALKVAAERWSRREIKQTECATCTTRYLQSVEAVDINGITTHGFCPLCRQLAAKDGFTPLVIGQASAQRAKKIIDGLNKPKA